MITPKNNRFTKNTLFTWNETHFEVFNVLPRYRIELVNLFTSEVMTVQRKKLEDAFFNDEIQFIVAQNGKNKYEAKPRKLNIYDLSDCTPWQKDVANFRYWVIQPFIRMETQLTTEMITKRIEEAVEYLQDKNISPTKSKYYALSQASVYRFLSLVENGGKRALVPSLHRGGKGKSRINSEIDAIILNVFEDLKIRNKRVPLNDLYHEVCMRVKEHNMLYENEPDLPKPAKTTIYRRSKQYDFDVLANKKVNDRQYNRTRFPDRPLARVEIDHTPIDLIVLDDETLLPLGKPHLTFCLDAATRYPLGYCLGFEPPSQASVFSCLKHAFLPKGNMRVLYGTENQWHACGLYSLIAVDNGAEFIGESLRDACHMLNITIQQMPVKTPEFKASVERFFRSQNSLIHQLDGTTYSNIFDKGDYDSMGEAVIRYSTLNKMMNIFLVDVYSQQLHRGLHAIPAREWERFIEDGFVPRLPDKMVDIDFALGTVKRRRAFSYGIDLNGLRYNHKDLALIRRHVEMYEKREGIEKYKVKLKFSPTDLGHIYVFDPILEEPKKIPVEKRSQEYATGLTIWQHKVIKKYVRDNYDQEDIYALARAKRHLRQLAAEDREHVKKATRKRTARFAHDGKSADEMHREKHQAQEQDEVEVIGVSEVDPASYDPIYFDLSEDDLDDWDVSYDAPVED